jgi:hypothetical protein
MPVEPIGPVKPVDPVAPVKPVGPVAPVKPVAPCGPVLDTETGGEEGEAAAKVTGSIGTPAGEIDTGGIAGAVFVTTTLIGFVFCVILPLIGIIPKLLG